MARRILSGYPDYGKAPREYLLSIVEYLALLSPDDQAALAHPTAGIASKCKFLPTKAEMAEFLSERHKRMNTRATGYRYLPRDRMVEMPPAERRKAQVLAELGYDPSISREHRPQPPGEADLKLAEEFRRGDFSGLKTPPGPISPEFRALLIEQGVLPRATSEAEAA